MFVKSFGTLPVGLHQSLNSPLFYHQQVFVSTDLGVCTPADSESIPGTILKRKVTEVTFSPMLMFDMNMRISSVG